MLEGDKSNWLQPTLTKFNEQLTNTIHLKYVGKYTKGHSHAPGFRERHHIATANAESIGSSCSYAIPNFEGLRDMRISRR